jgi:tRNA(Ile2) C34 agmatinyltransferase TiaS
VIAVATDYEGLRMAAHELHKEQLAAELSGDNDPGFMRTLSPGYYDRVFHLRRLQDALDLGIQIRLSDVDESEVNGLIAIKAGMAEFLRDHPRCPYCGTPGCGPADRTCRGCGRTLREKGQH